MSTDIDQQKVIEAEAKIPSDAPVTMINLLQFFDQAQYQDLNHEPCSGREAYMKRYATAFYEVATELGVTGVEVVYIGAVVAVILGPAEPTWDAIAVVRYRNFADLRKITENSIYFERAEPHRKAALKAFEWMATFEPQPIQ